MTNDQVIAFAVFAVVAAGTPGPANVLLAATGANVGVRRGVGTLLGVVLGTAALLFAVAFGLGAVLLRSPLAMQVLNAAGAAVLLWLSIRIAMSGRPEPSDAEAPAGFIWSAAVQWSNPKAWMVSTSASSTYLSADGGSAFVQAVAFGAIFAVAAMPACFVWLLFGAGMQRLLTSERSVRAFNVCMGVLLAGSIALIWV